MHLWKNHSLLPDNLYLSVAVTHPHTEGANEVLFKGEILGNGGEAPETFGIQLSSNITFENAETLLSSQITGEFFYVSKKRIEVSQTITSGHHQFRGHCLRGDYAISPTGPIGG